MTDEPPPPEDPRDAEHLRLLGICHYVWAALAAFGACAIGGMVLVFSTFLMDAIEADVARQRALAAGGASPSGPGAPPEAMLDFMRWMYGAMGAVYLVGGLTLAVLALLTARFLRQRRRRTFCFAASVVQCLAMPFGTALGVFTILVLSRESVTRRFEGGR